MVDEDKLKELKDRIETAKSSNTPNISISSGETPTTPPDKARFGGLLDPNGSPQAPAPEAQLLAVLTTGLNKSVFLDLAVHFRFPYLLERGVQVIGLCRVGEK